MTKRSVDATIRRQNLLWIWFECFFTRHGYELGRRMLPLHADPPLEASEAAQLQLGTLDVFGRRPPQAWPRLQQMRDEGLAGAEELYCLQQVELEGW